MDSNSATSSNDGRCLSPTSSRCSTESVTATHDFKVDDYRLLDGMGVGKLVQSSTFSVGGYDWCIVFFPDGLKNQGNHVSAYLRCLNPSKDVRAKFTLSMLALTEDMIELTNTSGLLHHTFCSETDDWGFSKFVEKSKLRAMTNDTCFTIRCVLTVIQDPQTTTEEVAKREAIVVPPPDLQQQLEELRKKGGCADVTFSVSGQVFNAHRCVLAARSPVFKAELFGPMKEKTAKCIEIDDIEPEIFEALLHFIYTDCLLLGEVGKTEELQHLLVAADRYGIERLRWMCEAQLCESVDAETAAITLVLAKQHDLQHLRDACIDFMASPGVLAAVLASDGFEHLIASCPLVMKEILEKMSARAE